MLKTYLMTLLAVMAVSLGLKAQVTSQPSPLQQNSAGVEIFFHADQGTKGLANLPASTGIYAHTGVITSASTSDGDWKYVNCQWGKEDPKYKLEYVSENLWKLNIGQINTFYGITDPSVEVRKLCFVFWADGGKKEGKGPGGSDIFLEVHDSGFQLALTPSVQNTVVGAATGEITFTAGTTAAADISISLVSEADGEKTLASASGVTTLKAACRFTDPGDYTIRATATSAAEGTTLTEEIHYCYARESAQAGYPGGKPVMGAARQADGSVIFCIAAPSKRSAMLIGSWNDYTPSNAGVMSYHDIDGVRYFWTRMEGLEAGKAYPYYYLIDGTYSVGDPYARLVLDPWNDKYINQNEIIFPELPPYPSDKVQQVSLAVYQDNINDYDWKVTDFKGVSKDDLIIYELLLRDFTGTEGQARGNGTVRKAMEKLDYLQSLNINAVELLPITEFNGNISWGYNPNFYFAPDKCYGTPDDYKAFIDACHERGIAVILDVVLNQADWQHPWYLMYEAGENPFFNASAPHAYSVLNDWNQSYPLVMTQWKDMLRYWMTEYKIDGFRFDLVKGLGDNSSYANSGDAATNAYNASRVARMTELHAAMKEVNPDAYFINENLAGAKEENEMAADGQLNWANINNAGCQFAMGYANESDLNRMYAPNDGRTWGSTVSYLESHDEQRLAYKQNQWGVTGVKGNKAVSMRRLGAAAAQMILAPGAHMIWQFSELGNDQNTKDASGGNNTDPKIVCWSLLDDKDHHGLYQSYRGLCHLRSEYPELFTEQARFSMACNVANWTGGRTLSSVAGDKELYTIINPNVTGEITVSVGFSKKDNAAYHIVSQSYGAEASFDAAAGKVTVPANSYVCVATRNMTARRDISDDAAEASVVSTEWYDLTGCRADNPADGMYVRVDRLSDGTSRASKVMLRK